MSLLHDFRMMLANYGLEHFNRYYATYKGVVVDNKDPEFIGRLMLKVTQVWGNDIHRYWAPSVGMPAGAKGLGLFMVPNVGDIVWVRFEAGDIRFPIWEYGPLTRAKTSIHAKTGHPDQAKAVVLQHTNGYRIVMDDVKKKIVIESGSLHMIIDGLTNSIRFESTTGVAIQPAVLGTTLVADLNELIADIGMIAGIVVPGASATLPIASSPQFAPLVAKWAAKFPLALSQIVKLQ